MSRRPALSTEKQQEVALSVLSGKMTITQAAKANGISQTTVYRYIEKYEDTNATQNRYRVVYQLTDTFEISAGSIQEVLREVKTAGAFPENIVSITKVE